MIEAKKVVLSLGHRQIFHGASFTISEGDKVGLVGRNGSGKTTLLKLVEGDLQPDGGEIYIPEKYTLASVSQKIPTGDMTLKQFVLNSHEELAGLLDRLETEEDPEVITKICGTIDDLDGFNQDYIAEQILMGLGFNAHDIENRIVDDLPGGLRMRLSIAALLFQKPDIMLLDEPSNHLDIEGTKWLGDYLRGHEGTVLLVSHDADFLDTVTRKTLFCANGQVRAYNGNFSQFQRSRAEEQTNLRKTAQNIEQKKQKIQSFADRFRGISSKSRQVQSKLKMLDRFNEISLPIEEKPPVFHFEYADLRSEEVLRLSDCDLGYGDDSVIVTDAQLELWAGETLGVIGANGNGKSTLLKTITGSLPLISGRLQVSFDCKIAYLGQIDSDELDSKETVLGYMSRKHPDQSQTRLRAALAQVGFNEDKVSTSLRDLSGGERTKLLITLLGMEPSNLLILDEPTNHLDYDSKVSLIRAIEEYPGATVVVSHDSFFLSSCADRFVGVSQGHISEHDTIKDFFAKLKTTNSKPEFIV